MKTFLLILAVAAGVVGVQDDRAAVNQTCPVMKGKRINPEILAVYKGSPIGFCCEKCKDDWDKDPAEYAANLDLGAAPKIMTLAVLGKPAPEFELRDTKGYIARSADFAKKIVILQWVDRYCPISERVAKNVLPGIAELAKKNADKIVHLSICSAPKATVEGIENFLSDHSIESRGLFDRDASTAKTFGAATSCHAMVIDAAGVLRYSGAIDDDATGKKGAKAVNHVLAAVNALLEGKKIATASSKPYGTPLKWPK